VEREFVGLSRKADGSVPNTVSRFAGRYRTPRAGPAVCANRVVAASKSKSSGPW